MTDKRPVAQSFMVPVPVLACIVLMLFSLNFFRFLDLYFFSEGRADIHGVMTHCEDAVLHEHLGPHASSRVFVFEHDQHQALDRAQRALDRARRDLDRLNERMPFENDVDQDNALRLKLKRLQRLQELERVRNELRQQAAQHHTLELEIHALPHSEEAMQIHVGR